jgi:hypothetical protein
MWVAGYLLPATFAVLVLLSAIAGLWLGRRYNERAATLAGYAAVCSLVLVIESLLLRAVVAWGCQAGRRSAGCGRCSRGIA